MIVCYNQSSNNIKNDPKSSIGIELGKRCMLLVDGLYGRKYTHLRTAIFEKGFGEGKGLKEVGLTPEIVSWLDKAIDAYWRQRIYDVLDRIGKVDSAGLLSLWNRVLDDMYGENSERKKAALPIIIDAAIKDVKVSKEAIKWLQGLAH